MNEITAENKAVLLEFCMDFIEKNVRISVSPYFPSPTKLHQSNERERHEGSSLVLNSIPFIL